PRLRPETPISPLSLHDALPIYLSGVVMTHCEWRKRPDDRAKRLRIGHLHPKASAHERQVPVRPDELPDLDALGCAAWHMRSMRQREGALDPITRRPRHDRVHRLTGLAACVADEVVLGHAQQIRYP